MTRVKEKLGVNSEIFTRAVEDIITREELSSLLRNGKKLRIKHGIDATSPGLHLGHAANLWKIRSLQEAGHRAVILLGDVTTQIGDPTGKVKTRPVLSSGEIAKNLRFIERLVRKILLTNPSLLEFRKSSEWYNQLNTPKFLHLLSMVTHARLIERDMFQKRIRVGGEIHAHELIYPVLQGYDSVMLKSDLTIIGSDQLFNEHMARHLQEKFGQKPQVIIALKILPGLDGGEKMSKSLGNYIGIGDSPRDQFGKAMRLLDSLIVPYLEVYTDVPLAEIKKVEAGLSAGKNPMEAKLFLAEALVRRYQGEVVAEHEREKFLKIFSRRELPDKMPQKKLRHGKRDLAELLVESELAWSRSEARRLLHQGAVSINGAVFRDAGAEVEINSGTLIKVGKRRFLKIL